nr:PREDICTED: protein D3-like [Bemisia tabaci]XP_018905857.1 PREDICTED: protein D3-like [Bemisia tabaci]
MITLQGGFLAGQKVFLFATLLKTFVTNVLGAATTKSHQDPSSSVETTTFLFNRTLMLERDKLVPDVLDAIPKEELFVSYYTRWINLGNLVGCSEVLNMPTVLDWPFEKGAYYTIILTGPDCPSRENHTDREYLHWLVTNVKETKFMAGDMIAEYIGAAPNYVSDAHRFLFVVFKQPQPDKMPFKEEAILDANPYNEKRKKFSTRNFAKKHGLEPVAANYYWINHNEPVPTFETWFRTPGDLTP